MEETTVISGGQILARLIVVLVLMASIWWSNWGRPDEGEAGEREGGGGRLPETRGTSAGGKVARGKVARG